MRHILVANWHIYEQHYCKNHDKMEYSEAWVTKGLVSVLIPKEAPNE